MERLRITVNFKHTQEDIALYNELQKYSCISGYIKDVLRGVLNINSSSSSKESVRVYDDISNDIDDILGD